MDKMSYLQQLKALEFSNCSSIENQESKIMVIDNKRYQQARFGIPYRRIQK
jgi:hypothetical protein